MSIRAVTVASIVAALLIGFGYGAFITRPAGPPTGTVTRLTSASVLPGPQALPDFILQNASGEPFGPAQLVGQWSLIFFGFASCGDVCPTTLATLAAASAGLKVKPRIVFLSVDPNRDTAAILSSYVAGFDADMLGVTGDDAEIRTLASALGVSYRVIPDPGAYLVEHSPAVFVINPDGRYVAVFTSPVDGAAIASDLATITGS